MKSLDICITVQLLDGAAERLDTHARAAKKDPVTVLEEVIDDAITEFTGGQTYNDVKVIFQPLVIEEVDIHTLALERTRDQ
jgi:hypothetical protein